MTDIAAKAAIAAAFFFVVNVFVLHTSVADGLTWAAVAAVVTAMLAWRERHRR